MNTKKLFSLYLFITFFLLFGMNHFTLAKTVHKTTKQCKNKHTIAAKKSCKKKIHCAHRPFVPVFKEYRSPKYALSKRHHSVKHAVHRDFDRPVVRPFRGEVFSKVVRVVPCETKKVRKNSCANKRSPIIDSGLSMEEKLLPPPCVKPRIYRAPYVENRFHTVLTLLGGKTWTHVGKSQSFEPLPDLSFNYNASNTNQHKRTWGVFIGEEFRLNPWWAIQLGGSYYQIAGFQPSGLLIQGFVPAPLVQSNYSYSVRSKQFYLESKLLANLFGIIHPYVSAGAGKAYNQVYGYQIANQLIGPITPLYTSKTNVNFTYSVGTGIDLDLTRNLRLGAGYRFADLGKVNLGEGTVSGLGVDMTLKQKHLYAKQLFAQITLVI